MASDLLEKEKVEQTTDSGDHDKFSHYVRKSDQDEYWLTGKPVSALCGKVWAPTSDPQKYTVCPSCKDIWEQMKP
ncbi:DUF3039 domain-containing protein [Curtobacterium citreum]|jgi:hypothetical protein